MKIKNPFFVKREYIYLADIMNLLNTSEVLTYWDMIVL